MVLLQRSGDKLYRAEAEAEELSTEAEAEELSTDLIRLSDEQHFGKTPQNQSASLLLCQRIALGTTLRQTEDGRVSGQTEDGRVSGRQLCNRETMRM